MNQLTQYQLNYIATFISQYEQGILNLIQTKFNNPKFKVSIWGIRYNKQLLRWYLLFFFNLHYKECAIQIFFCNYSNLIKLIIKNNLFFDFKIGINIMIKKNTFEFEKKDLSKYLVQNNLIKYLKFLIKSKYIDYKTLISQHYGIFSRFGLIPYSIKMMHDEMIYLTIEIVPKKYMELIHINLFNGFYPKCIELIKTNGDMAHNNIHDGYEYLMNHQREMYHKFIKKHNLLVQ